MDYIDLFAGVGGFHYGIQCAGLSGRHPLRQETKRQRVQTKRGLYFRRHGNARCVYANEWDKYANSVYKRHFGECDSRDIRTVDAIPNHELLCAGFPCQAFSVAGKRLGFNDTRGTLFFDVARILKEKQPRLCLLENVKGLLSHDHGRTIKVIFATLTELGYDLQWQVLNSKDFGVPQNRERIFIIGHLRNTPAPKVFPFTQGHQFYLKEKPGKLRQAGLSTALQSGRGFIKGSGETLIELTQNVSDAQRIYSANGIAKTLKGLGGGLGAKTGLYATPEVRRLTPLECERLQGFPDGWTERGAEDELMSDTQRYKMMGNAVTTTVVTAIAERLI